MLAHWKAAHLACTCAVTVKRYMFLSLANFKPKSHFLYKILTSSFKYKWEFHMQCASWKVERASALRSFVWNIHVPCNHMSGICISFYSRASHDRWCEIFLFFLVVCLLCAEEEGNTRRVLWGGGTWPAHHLTMSQAVCFREQRFLNGWKCLSRLHS